jgi:alginate O-acetyltransferase complex protein AlgI
MTLPSIVYALFLLSVVGMFWTLGNRSRPGSGCCGSQPDFLCVAAGAVPLLMVALMLVTFFIGNAIMAPLDWRIPNQRWQLAEKGWNRRASAAVVGHCH